MDNKIIKELTDLRYLNWSHARTSSGTAGTFLKSESNLDSKKTYYKLSNFDILHGVVGHECVNEIIVDRLLTIFDIEHLSYTLINALIQIDGREYQSYICASQDFKKKGESKSALDNFYIANRENEESPYDFCKRNGWQNYIDEMLAIDFIILNRDRHGANIEVLKNTRTKTLRIAPLFDHGLSLLCSCHSDADVLKFDVMEDKRCQNFIGSYSCHENLDLIEDKKAVFKKSLKQSDKAELFEGLDDVISYVHQNKIWDMIYTRYKIYEAL